MKGRIERRGLLTVNRTLTGILAAAIVMSNLSGTGLVVQAAESEAAGENGFDNQTEELSSEVISIQDESVLEETITSEEIVSEKVIQTEETFQENTSNEIQTEESDSQEITIEDSIIELSTEMETEEPALEEATDEECLFASVYLQFDTNGGTCDVSVIELTPDNMELALPQAEKAGYRFRGWYMDAECTIAFDEDHIFWEAGSTYVLYAGYEQLAMNEEALIEKTLQQSVNGVTITVEGNMPAEAILDVSVEELTLEEQKNIANESDIVESVDSLKTGENTSYSYDISICYQNVEYEPYLFDEKVEVTFSFSDDQELQNAQQIEVFHIDDNEDVEKIEIKEVSEKEVSFEADAFSTYILITKVEYSGNQNWTFGFTGDVQTFTAPVSGQYVFECYGAGTDKSKGSFAKGTIGLEKNETVSIYVGGKNNTFNGGGKGGNVWHSASNSEGSFNGYINSDPGCGATDVRIGTDWEGRIIVAGGGAGNGQQGGVWYSHTGTHATGGPGRVAVNASNSVKSSEVLGLGEDYSSSISAGTWGDESDPKSGTYNIMTVKGGGGGGYYGGKAGYAGTSKVISSVLYEGKEYSVADSVVENLVYSGDGKCLVSLYSLEADVITYYNYNMTELGDAAGLTGTTVSFPELSASPERASDAMYDYTFMGWDDMATETIEHYTAAETVGVALNGDRNYIAAYECMGKSYAVAFDSADAQNAGTTSIIATYHSALPDINIPAKEGSVFDGYFTGQNGTGTKVYSADGKSVTISEFEQDTILYAHWVQPVVNVMNPENKEVLAGYAGVVLSTDVELCQPTGYALTYQWYINHENSNTSGSPIEAAESKKLVIPQGFQPGQYYFYCLITATNVLNGQAVNVLTTPALLSVEKGVMGMDQIEIETAESIYDGTPHVLKAAINNSNPYTIYYGVEPLNSENYRTKGTTEPYGYTEAGSYTNYIYVTGVDFADFSGSITMTIQKAEPHVYLPSKNTSYNGQVQTVDVARVYDVNDREMEILVAYVYFMDEACTKKTNRSCGALTEGGAPSAVGTYYVHAVTEETSNYHDVATKNPAMFNILGTDVKYSISGYHGMYDGKPHGLQIVNEDEANATIYFSDSVELTKDNYLLSGTVVPFEYTEVGRYPIYYIVVTKLAGGINQYEAGLAEIVIEEAKQNIGGNESGNDNDSNDHGNSGSNSTSDNTQNENQQDTEEAVKPHKHNYELVSFEEPTANEEGKAVYRCAECGHELVISYPANGEAEEDIEEEKSKTEIEEFDEKTQDKEKDKYGKETEDERNGHGSSEELSEELKKALTEAELLRIAETLRGLSEDEIRDLYKKGFLNITQGELDRLLAMIRTQVIIDEEKVSLSENLPSAEVDETSENVENTKKQNKSMWNLLWAFLLGAAVMFLIRRIMEVRKDKTQKYTSAPTRKLK